MSLHDLLTGMSRNASLRGRRVLVVEDDYVVAQDLCEQLLSCGVEVLGPVACVAGALALLESGLDPHMAVLDIGLGPETVYPVADVLRARGVPFVFATGYDACMVPKAFADVPRAEKPLALAGDPAAAGW
ncbi:response regulator [Rubellimicrobium aerolatum]|uniref:Response regulator n=1 Tax=Rubellimicrobium aerolatum TaxID=490979 RepID=A0ABW0SA84_9RHOB|nr:response regulator [Rubellimicrobium aerolatum]MBP1805251.1 CheY-like chemotaxis protein [Rubellimicrobium aerolatum]